ncbi:MAG: DUF3108 domain-containing protein [Burkholderiales bacterium]|nr:DUF3108 domain-containing protein [Burkholderiales bacterium]
MAALHLALVVLWPADRFGLGEGSQAPPRIEVSFVRELKPALPAAPPEAATRVLRAMRPLRAASAPAAQAGEERAPLVLDEALREPAAGTAGDPLPEIASAPSIAGALAVPAIAAAAAAGAAAAATLERGVAAAPAAPAFEWPPSTRLSYLLTGNYHGPVEGQARVEWRLAGDRYQVSLEVGIGPPFAPLVTRQIQSDGLVTAGGLEPRRYDEETQVVLRTPRRFSILLDPDRVLLPNGRQVPRPAGVQDSASQFVQMTWLFTTQPARLLVGSTVQLPLALARRVEVWTYEVVGETTLHTPVGAIEAVHVRPRRPPPAAGGAGGDLVAEFWVAPTLQYLPVRILIRQDEETYVDLHLERLPQQAESRR